MSRRTAMNPPTSGPVAAPQLASQLANTLTDALVSVLASWLASWGAATGPDVGGFMAVLRDMGRFHGVHARRSSCPADGYLSPACLCAHRTTGSALLLVSVPTERRGRPGRWPPPKLPSTRRWRQLDRSA